MIPKETIPTGKSKLVTRSEYSKIKIQFSKITNDVFVLDFTASKMAINSQRLVFVPKSEVLFGHCGIELNHGFIIMQG